MLCILYVTAVGTLLGIMGLLVERALPATWPRRWLWCLIIPMSVVIPALYRTHHASSIAALDPGWWARVETWGSVISPVWLAASAALVIWGLASALRIAQLVHRARRAHGQAYRQSVVDGIRVVVTDAIGPATVGVLRSRLLIPQWVLALPGAQRRYVLCHEEEHRRAHDPRLLFVASLLLLLLPWNLALWWQLKRLRLAVEMDCDNRVVAALGDPHSYGELLLKVAQAASRGPRIQPAFLGGAGMLERRLTVLLAPAPLRRVQRFLLPALALALLFLVLSMPHPVLGHAPNERTTITHGHD